MLHLMSTNGARATPVGCFLLALTLTVGCSSTDASSPSTTTSNAGSSTTEGSTTEGSTTEPAGSTTVSNCRRGDLPSTVAYDTIAGVDPNLLSLDVYPPSTAACDAPIVMWVHGGGYQIGDKRNQMLDKVALFNDAGWILVSVNYRLTAPGAASSAQYPDHFHDVASAVAWVHVNIASYGGDPERIALLGHSAGADIVSNVATNPSYLQAVGLDLGSLRCAGPLDTEGFDKVAAGANDPDVERDQWQLALGNNLDYLTATSATMLVAADIGIPPMIGVVRGGPLRQRIETAFLGALADAGINSVTIDATSLTHNEVNSRIGAAGDDVMTAPLMQFLHGCFAGP